MRLNMECLNRGQIIHVKASYNSIFKTLYNQSGVQCENGFLTIWTD